jgi:hypothetical protein
MTTITMSDTPEEPAADDLRGVLLDDVLLVLDLEPQNAAHRRAAIRSVYAAVEGLLHELRQELLAQASERLSREQTTVLKEERYSIKDSGEVRVDRDHQTLKQRVRFTVRVVEQLHPEYKIDFADIGWSHLLASLGVRDRLMHPKSRADLDVTDEELNSALGGLFWFVMFVLDPGRASLRAIKAVERMRKMLHASAYGRNNPGMHGYGFFGTMPDYTDFSDTPVALRAAEDEKRAKQAKKLIRPRDKSK